MAAKKKKRLRDMTYADYGISKFRYRELRAFCRQYPEKKSKINYGLSAMVVDGQPHGNGTSDPTQQQALENLRYTKDVSMIEEAAIRANPDIWRYIIRSVTESLPYEQIQYDKELGRLPMGKTEFNAYRRLFYGILHKLKLGS